MKHQGGLNMRLGYDPNDWRQFSSPQLKQLIKQRRAVLRYFHKQTGHKACWIMYQFIYYLLNDSKSLPTRLPEENQAMGRCTIFYQNHTEYHQPKITPNAKKGKDDDTDLENKTVNQLIETLFVLQIKIKKHRYTPNPTTADDQNLLEALPERPIYNPALPPRSEFLYGHSTTGTMITEGGCKPFWNSHASCQNNFHNFDTWGPCKVIDDNIFKVFMTQLGFDWEDNALL